VARFEKLTETSPDELKLIIKFSCGIQLLKRKYIHMGTKGLVNVHSIIPG
jgi:hypothetical protein